MSANPSDRFVPPAAIGSIIVLAAWAVTAYPHFAESPVSWFALLKQNYPAAIKYGAWIIIVLHSIEAAMALVISLRRGYSFGNLLKWTVACWVFGYPSTSLLLEQGKVIKKD